MAVETLCSSSGSALVAVINKSRSLGNYVHNMYTKLFNFSVNPFIFWIWCCYMGIKYPRFNNILIRASRFFLSVPRSTPLVGMEWEWVGFRLSIHKCYLK